jgi:hypothetical protein
MRWPGQRGIKQATEAIALVDPKAASPKETWPRLLIVRAGFPLPDSQYPVYNEYGVLIGMVDFAWPELKIAVEYEGRHHTDPEQIRKDIPRIEEMIEMGWIVIRVTARDGEVVVVRRIANARAARGAVDEVASYFQPGSLERLWITGFRAS